MHCRPHYVYLTLLCFKFIKHFVNVNLNLFFMEIKSLFSINQNGRRSGISTGFGEFLHYYTPGIQTLKFNAKVGEWGSA